MKRELYHRTGNLEVSCWKVSWAKFHDHERATQNSVELVNRSTETPHHIVPDKPLTRADFFSELVNCHCSCKRKLTERGPLLGNLVHHGWAKASAWYPMQICRWCTGVQHYSICCLAGVLTTPAWEKQLSSHCFCRNWSLVWGKRFQKPLVVLCNKLCQLLMFKINLFE